MKRAKSREMPNSGEVTSPPANLSNGAMDLAAVEQFLQLTTHGVWRYDVVPSVSIKLPEREQAVAILECARLGFCNPAAARLHGHDRPEDLMGQPLAQFLVGDEDERVGFIAAWVRAGHRLADLEVSTRGRDGRTVWTLSNVSGIVKRGRVTGGWGTSYDITDRKLAEAALHEAHANLQATLAALPDLVFEVDATGRILQYHAPTPETLYTSPTVFLGKVVSDILPPDAARPIVEALNDAARNGSQRGARYALDLADGRHWFELSIASREGEFGTRATYVAIARDVTDREKASAALQASEERLALALDATSDGIYDADLVTGVTTYSPGYATMLGYASEELRPGQDTWLALLHPDDRDRAIAVLDECVAGRSDEYEMEFRLRAKTGDWRWILSQGKVVGRGAEGSAQRIVGTHRDITHRVRVREELRRQRDLAQLYLDTAQTILIVLSVEGRIELVNGRGCELLGCLSPGDLLGKDWFSTCLPERIAAETSRVFIELMAGRIEGAEYHENPVRTANGEERLIAWHNAVLRDALTGEISGVVSSGQDITDQRNVEAERSRALDLLRRSEEISHVGSWELDPRENRLLWSDEVYRIFGLPSGETAATYDHFLMCVHADDRQLVDEAYRGSIRDGKDFYEVEHRLVRPSSGEVRHVLERCIHQRDATGAIVRSVGMVQDITDSKVAQDGRRESEERFRRIFDESPIGMVTVSTDLQFTKANAAFCRMVGYAEEELLGLRFVDITHPDHRASDLRGIEQAVRGDVPSYRTEKRYLRKDGQVVWGSVAASAMRDAEGRVQYFLAMIEDTTAAKAAEAALAESERRYREMANALPTCVFETDLEGLLTYANQTGLSWFGFSEEEAVGKRSIVEMVAPEQRDVAKRTLRRAVEVGAVPAGEYTAVRRDGTTFPALVSSRALVRDGQTIGLRGILIDISERVAASRRMERALGGTIHALAMTTEMRDPFTAGHQERVTRLAVAIGKRVGLTEAGLEGLRVAGLLHDVGKVSVPAEILSKPAGLTEIEMGFIRSHSETGHAILREIDFPWPVAEIVLQHHERVDGSGYPRGLRGNEILLEARILAVADSVEAMASHRPYRAAHSLREALAEIERGRGVLYDPDIASACAKVFEDGFQFDA